MFSSSRPRVAYIMLALATAAVTASSAFAERWPGTTASIGGAIAARVIGVKCANHMSPAEVVELDTYIEQHQTAFMSESPANRRLAETAFPRIARDYDFMYSQPDACNDQSRAMAQDMLSRIRAEDKKEKQAGLAN